MNIISCHNCGAQLHRNDVFCRRCGAKKQSPGTEREAGFCPKCGNAPRDGAKFCDMCGEEFYAPEQGDTRLRGKRGRRRKRGCLLKLLLLVLLIGIAAAAVINRHRLSPIFREFAVIPEVVSEYFRALRPSVVSDDTASSGHPSVVSRDEIDGGAKDRGIESPDDERDDEVSGDTAPDTAAGERETPVVIAAPLTEELGDGSPDLFISPDVSPDSTISPDVSAPSTEPEAFSGMPEVVWTERDRDGYSFLSPADRFAPGGEVSSLRGAVSGDHVRVRDRPSTRGRIRRQFNNGVSVDVTGRFASGEERYYWFRISSSGEVGWIYGEFLKVESTGSEVENIIQ